MYEEYREQLKGIIIQAKIDTLYSLLSRIDLYKDDVPSVTNKIHKMIELLKEDL